MNYLVYLRNCLLATLIALLLLTQSYLALGSPLAGPIAGDGSPLKTMFQKNVISPAEWVDLSPEVVPAVSLLYWIARRFSLATPTSIRYRACRLFVVHPAQFNRYYTHLSALAP